MAVAEVKQLFVFSTGIIAPVRLATQDMPIIYKEPSIASGWGIEDSGRESHILRVAEIPTVDMEECRIFWGPIATDRVLCAGVQGIDTCSGDSGGPIVFRGLQVGITSSGSGPCGGGTPALYTSIAHPEIRQFIRDFAKA